MPGELYHAAIDIMSIYNSDGYNTLQLEFFHLWWPFRKGFGDLQYGDLSGSPHKLTVTSRVTLQLF